MGRLENGKDVVLSCPHPRAFVGRGNYEGLSRESVNNAAESLMVSHLKASASRDSGMYYFIGKLDRTEERDIFVIPYVTFEK